MPVSDADLTVWLNNLRVVIVAARKQTSAPKMSAALAPTLTTIDAELALVKPPVVAPPAPMNMSATQTAAGTVVLTWSPSPTALGYNVWRNGVQIAWPALTNIGAAPLKVNADGTLTYTDTGGLNEPGGGLALGAYSYQVGAYSTLLGPLSAAAAVTVAVPTVPPVTPSSGQRQSWEGIFAYDHKFATAQSLLARFGLSAPTAARPMLAILHLPRATGWEDAENTFWTDWVGSGPAWRKCITVPGWPDKAESGASLAAVANGTNDAHYRTIIRKVVAMFPGEVHEYRFMHEANCCYNHKAVNDPASYKKGFDRFYGIAHEEDPGCIVVFCPIYGDGNIAIEAIEPPRLNKYALDYYGSRWDYQTFVTAGHGLNFLAARGDALKVPIGLYEFGPGEWGGTSAVQTMPDDPAWVDKLRAFQKAHPVDIVNYVDDTRNSGGVRSDFTVQPQCLKRWVATSVTKAA